jgi:hypothetical protein
MGSKTPLNRRSPVAHPDADLVSCPAPNDGPAESLLLRRIAGALQVPPSALYSLPNAIRAGSPSEVNAVARDIEIDCEAVLLAFRRIRDPEMRRRLLIVVQEAAERH